MPSTGRPLRARSSSAAANPRSRSQARSATVAREPGSTTRSASASSAGRLASRTSTPGSAASASMSVKLLIRGSRTTLTRSTSAPSGSPVAPGRDSRASESSASSQRPGAQGSTPSTGRPVRLVIMSRPGSSSSRAPRNLLITNPEMSAWSAGSSSATVPYSAANEPPRSMSVTTTTGRPAARARPMLAMSVARRLISAGLPAPSQTTTSNSRRSWARQSSATSSSRALRAG